MRVVVPRRLGLTMVLVRARLLLSALKFSVGTNCPPLIRLRTLCGLPCQSLLLLTLFLVPGISHMSLPLELHLLLTLTLVTLPLDQLLRFSAP
jgi:hypothetical protein